ncbi:MAG: V-type ATPase subunit [Candidatus Omnitrophica bacterium]|nr:V-type ATPase subunit [Candidatus Omnitrophota bacterium]
MRQISRFAYPNTRLRAMISRLLGEDFFSRISGMDLNSFLDALEKTTYSEIVKNRQILTPENFEIACISYGREKLKAISKFFLSKNEKRLILLLDERYIIEQIKFALRLWKKKQKPVNTELIGEFSSILNAETLDDIIKLLKDSGYDLAIDKVRDAFQKTNWLYPVEIAIDRQYFEKLQTAIEKLLPSDQTIARTILGAEIDRENLLWLGRIRLYYFGKVPFEFTGFIPGGKYLSEEELKKLMIQEKITANEFKLPDQYTNIIEKLPEKISEIDTILEGVILHQIRKAFIERPFSIGIPLGYIFLKQRETKRIISTFVSKYILSKVYQ